MNGEQLTAAVIEALAAGRSKDREDVRDVIAVQEGNLDWNYVHHWAEIHATRKALDEIVASIPPEIIAPGTQGNKVQEEQ